MKVIIKQRHTLNTEYLSCSDCALSRAIREQHPKFMLRSVGGTHVTDSARRDFAFKCFGGVDFDNSWHSMAFDKLKSGEIRQFVLDIPVPWYDEIYQQPSPKVIHIYHKVEVPSTIEQSVPETSKN